MTDTIHYDQDLWFRRPPRLPLVGRVGVVVGLLLLSVYGQSLVGLGGGVVAAVVFRWLCCHDLAGLRREGRQAALFALLVVLLALPASALPTGSADLLGLGVRTGVRFFLFLSPSITFARSLYPREGVVALQRLLPSSLLLSLEIALRFLPLLVQEASDVFRLQRQRGAFRRGPWSQRLQAVVFPFFARVFRMADRVAFALRARGVDPTRQRALVSAARVRTILGELRGELSCPD